MVDIPLLTRVLAPSHVVSRMFSINRWKNWGIPGYPSPEASHSFEQLPLLLHKNRQKLPLAESLRCTSAESGDKYKLPLLKARYFWGTSGKLNTYLPNKTWEWWHKKNRHNKKTCPKTLERVKKAMNFGWLDSQSTFDGIRTGMSMEVSNWIASWFITYLRDL